MDSVEFLNKVYESLNKVYENRNCLNYCELILAISSHVFQNVKYSATSMFNTFWYAPEKSAQILKITNDMLIHIRDVKKEDLRDMHTGQQMHVYISYHIFKVLLNIKRCLSYDMMGIYDRTISKRDQDGDIYIYPYLLLIKDVLDLIIYRHYEKATDKFKHVAEINLFTHGNICAYIKSGMRVPSSKSFQFALQGKNGVSHLLTSEKENCVICGDEIYEDSDFAVLDTCNHFMCTDCADVCLMSKVSLVTEEDPIGISVEMGKIAECPCCRRKVNNWCTSKQIMFYITYGCHQPVHNVIPYLKQKEISNKDDLFMKFIRECQKFRYSTPCILMAVVNYGFTDKKEFEQFLSTKMFRYIMAQFLYPSNILRLKEMMKPELINILLTSVSRTDSQRIDGLDDTIDYILATVE